MTHQRRLMGNSRLCMHPRNNQPIYFCPKKIYKHIAVETKWVTVHIHEYNWHRHKHPRLIHWLEHIHHL